MGSNHIHRDRAAGESTQQPTDAAQIGCCRGDDVDAAFRIVHPVDRHLVNAQSAALGEHQQLGVEEPTGVLDVGQQLSSHIGTNRLETALGVGESRRQCRFENEVVAARDDLALRSPSDVRAARQAGADREVRVAGDQRRHQGAERGQIGRQVDVGVDEDGRVGGRPHVVQCPSPPLLLETHAADVAQLGGQLRCDVRGVVGAGVVGDRDARCERHRIVQIAVQPVHRIRQHGLFVVDGDDDVEHRRPGDARRAGGMGSAFDRNSATTCLGHDVGVCHGVHVLSLLCAHRGPELCAGCDSVRS